MQFIVTGFTPDAGFRVFAFEGIAADQTRTEFTVRADLSLIRKYGIRVQELPLLCRGVLEQRDESKQERTLTFTEEGMRMHADICAANQEANDKKKSMRKIPQHQAAGSGQPPQSKGPKLSDSDGRAIVQPRNHFVANGAG